MVRNAGYAVMSATEVLAEKLYQVATENAPELLTRDATKQLIDELRKSAPAVVDELTPDLMKLPQIQQILKNLVAERVSIRPLALILETLGDQASQIRNSWELTEIVRGKLARHITSQLAGADDNIQVFRISPDLEDQLASSWERQQDEIRLDLPRSLVEGLVVAVHDAAKKMLAAGIQPVCLVRQSIRPVIAELTFDSIRDLTVIGDREISNAEIQVVGEITEDQIRIPGAAA